ncbi:MAG: flagellar biosynthesis protein FlhB [Candidatus Anammoxibacter sp.]
MADPSKTEQATSKKLSEAKNKGNVGKSTDLSQVVSLFTAFLIINMIGFFIYRNLISNMQTGFTGLVMLDFNINSVSNLFFNNVKDIVIIISPIMAGLLFVGLLNSYLQTGFRFTLEPLKPNLSKLNPVTGVKNLFSLKSLVKLIMGIAKVAATGIPAYFLIKHEIAAVQDMSGVGFAGVFVYAWQAIFSITIKILAILFIIAIIDVIYQKWQWKRSLKMSKQEVKDERKQAEGDEEAKRRIKGMQQQMIRKMMMQDVPAADVIVTNPTHYAVALKYDSIGMEAPSVVAKGMNLVAERIKELAKEHDIPVMEDKFLAQTLYKTVDIGQEIPAKLYQAVAKILSYVYNLKSVA